MALRTYRLETGADRRTAISVIDVLRFSTNKTGAGLRRKASHTAEIVTMLVIAPFIVLLAYSCTNYIGKQSAEPDAVEALSMAKQFVERMLVAPSTAKFVRDGYSHEVARNNGDGTWTVRVVVDSQNGFGAMIRGRYLVTIRHLGGDRWRLVEIQEQ